MHSCGSCFVHVPRDSELIDQFIQVNSLPEKDRHILKALLEAFIKKHRFEELAME